MWRCHFICYILSGIFVHMDHTSVTKYEQPQKSHTVLFFFVLLKIMLICKNICIVDVVPCFRKKVVFAFEIKVLLFVVVINVIHVNRHISVSYRNICCRESESLCCQ